MARLAVLRRQLLATTDGFTPFRLAFPHTFSSTTVDGGGGGGGGGLVMGSTETG